ncbi:MAG: ribose 5-phosphate isomerase B [Chloroflexota bacterium]
MLSESQVKELVKQVVERKLGSISKPTRPLEAPAGVPALSPGTSGGRPAKRTSRPLVTEEQVLAAPPNSRLTVPRNGLVTPLARTVAMERHVTLISSDTSSATVSTPSPGETRPLPEPLPGPQPGSARRVALGADHGGFEMKEDLKAYLQELGYTVKDVGTFDAKPVDYPDFALAVAQAVAGGDCFRGIMVDGAGIGSCMVANKVPGVRAAMCYDLSTARNSREHNDANVLTLGGRLIGANLAREIAKLWLETPFGGGRHQARVDKIMSFERRAGR